MPAFAYGLAQEIAASTTSGSTQLEAGAVNFRVFAHSASSSSVVVYIKTGATAPTATAAGNVAFQIAIQPGVPEVFALPAGHRYIAAITTTGTATVSLCGGVGE